MCSRARILFPFLEATKLVLDGQSSLLGLWSIEIDVNFFLHLDLPRVQNFFFLAAAWSLVLRW